jgi:hypothetical protein
MPAVKTPLGIIALFVATIELFLAYPVTQLQNTERLIMVLFMVLFPTYVATAFFVILWHKPIHLYSPQDITPGLENRYQPNVGHLVTDFTELSVKLRQVESEQTQLQLIADKQLASGNTDELPDEVSQKLRELQEQISSLNEQRVQKADQIARNLSQLEIVWEKPAIDYLVRLGIMGIEATNALRNDVVEKSPTKDPGVALYIVDIRGMRIALTVGERDGFATVMSAAAAPIGSP